MATYSTSEFKGGLKLLLDGDPCTIIENEFVKPGKGQAFNRVKIRNLKTGRVLEKTFRSGETVEAAVEQGCPVESDPSQHPPDTGGPDRIKAVVQYHPGIVADAQRAHRGGELLRRRQREHPRIVLGRGRRGR